MISPDAAFEATANAAAIAFARAPAAIRYRLDARVTADGRTTETTTDEVERPHEPPVTGTALPPAVDALAQWAFAIALDGTTTTVRLAYERPRLYTVAVPGERVDVVVSSVGGYRVTYAAGDPNRLHLEPVTREVRAFAAAPDHFTYSDIVVDPATTLPSHVVLRSTTETLTLDYAVVGGAWLVRRAVFDGVSRSGRASRPYELDATYDDFTFE